MMAYNMYKAVSYATSQSAAFSPISSFTAAARDWKDIKIARPQIAFYTYKAEQQQRTISKARS